MEVYGWNTIVLSIMGGLGRSYFHAGIELVANRPGLKPGAPTLIPGEILSAENHFRLLELS